MSLDFYRVFVLGGILIKAVFFDNFEKRND